MRRILLVSGLAGGLSLILGFSGNNEKDDFSDFVYIPQGSTDINGLSYSTDAFWISEHEVTNYEYRLFLHYLKDKGRSEEYEICKVDGQKWTAYDPGLKPFEEYYSSHPSYNDYPVLNISYEAAELYCKWLTEMSEDKNQVYRLPTKIEWIYAAKGGYHPAKYSWGGESLRNKKGELMCNFRRIGDEFIHTDSENNLSVIPDNKNADHSSAITSPVESYWPNEYGLYNTCGNAAEMIKAKGIAMGGSWNSTGYDVRLTSEAKYNGPNPFTGFRPVRVSK